MNNQSVHIGDLIMCVMDGAVEPQILGEVTHLGNVLDNGHVQSFVVKGHLEPITPAKWPGVNRWVAIPRPEQWPEEVRKYVQTFPKKIRQRVSIARVLCGTYFQIIDRETLKPAWIKTTMIESVGFHYDPQQKCFGNGQSSIEASYNALFIADKEVDLPEGFELNE